MTKHTLVEPGTPEAQINFQHIGDRDAQPFHIVEDAEIVQVGYSEPQRHVGNVALSVLEAAGHALVRPLGTFATNASRELKLALLDAKEGTDYRSQYHAKLKQKRIARKVAKLGIL